MKMKDEVLKEFVDNVIQERMQSAFSEMKAGKKPDEDDVEQKYEEAVSLLPEDKQQACLLYTSPSPRDA